MAAYKAINNAIAKMVDASVFEAKKDVVSKLMEYLEEKVELAEDIKDLIVEFKENLVLVPSKAAKKRAPNEYNKFMKVTMARLKEENPGMDTSERMTKAAGMYQEYKRNKSASASASSEEEPSDVKATDDEMKENTDSETEAEAEAAPKQKAKRGRKAKQT